jgi:hypothetical protein
LSTLRGWDPVGVTMKNDTHKDTHHKDTHHKDQQHQAAASNVDRDKVARALEACRSRRSQAIGPDEARTLDSIMSILDDGSSPTTEPASHTPHTPAT